jgi:sphingolipid 4-desaturase/C4-monooxygenase
MTTPQVIWHDERRARIRRHHSEVTELYGPDRRTALVLLVVVASQLAMARFVVGKSLVVWLSLTVTVGATLAHALGVLIHEAGHHLISRSRFANMVWLLTANLPLGAPAAVTFRAQHSLHHRYLGDADGADTQAPTRDEDAWVGTSSWRKFASFSVGRFFYKSRPANAVSWDGWMVANWLTTLGVTVAVLEFWGGRAIGYLLASSVLAFGPHPFGARRLSEHLPVRAGQPTNSYYGTLNWLSLNVGYHVEHHDFPNIAWTRLPRLRALAHEDYVHLFSFRSWTRLLVSYLTDSRYRVSHYVGMGPLLGERAATTSAYELPPITKIR